MPYAFTLTTNLPASAQEIYDAWLDSLAHSEMTGGAASMSDEIDAEVSAWDGYITGRNLELMPGQRIVQSWRTTRFSDDHEDSIITVTLEEVEDGTLVTLMHSNVPDEQTSYERGGWEQRYFEPMRNYFASRARSGSAARQAAVPKSKRAAGKKAGKKATKKATKKAGKKSKRVAPKAKAKTAVGKKRPKRAGNAKAKGKRTKKASSKAGQRRR